MNAVPEGGMEGPSTTAEIGLRSVSVIEERPDDGQWH